MNYLQSSSNHPQLVGITRKTVGKVGRVCCLKGLGLGFLALGIVVSELGLSGIVF